MFDEVVRSARVPPAVAVVCAALAVPSSPATLGLEVMSRGSHLSVAISPTLTWGFRVRPSLGPAS